MTFTINTNIYVLVITYINIVKIHKHIWNDGLLVWW